MPPLATPTPDPSPQGGGGFVLIAVVKSCKVPGLFAQPPRSSWHYGRGSEGAPQIVLWTTGRTAARAVSGQPTKCGADVIFDRRSATVSGDDRAVEFPDLGAAAFSRPRRGPGGDRHCAGTSRR